MQSFSRPTFRVSRADVARYGVALAATLLAAGGRSALDELAGIKLSLLTFFPAIMFSAWFGGWGPGILSTVLAASVTPISSLHIEAPGDIVAFSLFIAIGVLISALNESLHRGRERERAARQAAEQSDAQRRLHEEALEESEKRLRVALAVAESANHLKDQFVATVSHELRTPLNAVLGWADMLQSGKLDPSRRERALQAIYRNARRQTRLVDELLDISRIMSGKLKLRRASVDPRAVLRAALEVVQASADARRIHLAVDVDASLGSLYADGERLQQVCWNLLSNSIKFTPEGGAVHVRLRRGANILELVVADTGRGIPAEFLPSVFQPFSQADGSTTRSEGGLGLGLSIVKHIVEAHGGTVAVENAVGGATGATFTVRLPIVAVYEAEKESQSGGSLVPARSIDSLTGVSVLVVDDDPDVRELVTENLQQHQAVVMTAASASEAIEILKQTRVDVVLADIAMPLEDGYALITKIRASADPNVASIPAAALTALAREDDRQEALRAGFQLHLSKPIESRALVDAVAVLAQSVEPLNR